MKSYLAFDLGGTKVLAAVIQEDGTLLETLKEKVIAENGPVFLFDQMARMASSLHEKYQFSEGAVASAGPLDPVQGLLLDPTNFKTAGRGWGVVRIVDELKKRLPWVDRLVLENDAAAAALAEAWKGAARAVENSVTVTLGTGVGVGVIANGRLIRAGRELHPEGGHIIIEHVAEEVLCECGNYGCAEAYLSGTNFTKYMRTVLGVEKLKGEELVRRAQAGEEKICREFDKYGERLAVFLNNLSMLFAPQVIVLAGGFAEASDLFLPKTRKNLENRLRRHREGVDLLPQIEVSEFASTAGLIGAVAALVRAR